MKNEGRCAVGSALDGRGNVQSGLLGRNHTLLKAYDLVEEYLRSAFYRL